ncbi:hypothetical protein C8R46DRAFT_1246218 [Mycena filopes]|nr:hypothetical protein C8R46DRAFT_1246218 [Mycena filopes]
MLDLPRAGIAAAAAVAPLNMTAAVPLIPLVNRLNLNLDFTTTPIFLPSFFTLCAVYPLLAPGFATPRQRAWILTTLASAVMTIASLPFVADYLFRAGGGVAQVQLRQGAAAAVNRFFQAYLAADMIVGALYYRSQIGFLTGWVHHAVYLCITETAIRFTWAHIFCFGACMELPTLLLGLGTLRPRLRSDALFALTFLATRILLHLVLLAAYARDPATRVPAGVLGAVFPLHAMWFSGCVKGFVRRWRAQRASSSASASRASTSASSPESTTTKKHPLAADIYPDARSLARHAQPPHVARLRAWPWTALALDQPPAAFIARRLPIRLKRPLRPRARAMARRMSASLLAALPSREVVLDYVMGVR